MARGRRLARYKKTGIAIAVTGIAGGIAAVLLWPRIRSLFQNPRIIVGTPTIKRAAQQVGALLE